MSLLARLESKLGRFAMPNLVVGIVGGQVLVYLFNEFQRANGHPDALIQRLTLVTPRVLEGEIWRLVTFMLVPEGRVLLFLFFYWYLLYLFGSALEQHWGAFRFNAYLLIGYLATLTVAFLGPPMAVSNFFLYTSVFLAFAQVYPDFELRVYFLIPVKVKWLAWLTWLGFAYLIIRGGFPVFLMVAATVANFMLFFGHGIWHSLRDRRRRRSFHKRTETAIQRVTHECRLCGLTSAMAPKMQFRYCSQCDGQTCYCADHIRDHEHV